jgi:uncharacterized DUF497 family protein
MAYTSTSCFEWDDAKSEACWRERGFDFAYVATAFADPNRLILSDTRQVYGEDRFQLMGRIEERLFVVTFTPRDGATRIISARKANAREAARYQRRLHSDEDCCAGTDVSNTEETSHEEGPQGD